MANSTTSKKIVTRAGLLLGGSLFFILAGAVVIGIGALHHSNVRPDIAGLLQQPISLLKVVVVTLFA